MDQNPWQQRFDERVLVEGSIVVVFEKAKKTYEERGSDRLYVYLRLQCLLCSLTDCK